MPWQERSVMVQRQDFVALVQQEGLAIAEACRCAGISRPTGYRWLARAAAGETGGVDRSRRPHRSLRRTSAALEALVLALRTRHPAWGGATDPEHHHRHLAPPRPARRHPTAPRLRALRTGHGQRVVAKGLHGASPAGDGAGASADLRRRPFALCAVPAGVCRRAATDRAGADDGGLSGRRAANGGRCRTTCHPGARSGGTSVGGGRTACGRRSIRHCVSRPGCGWDGTRPRVRRS